MSSTSGLKSGNLLNELARVKYLHRRKQIEALTQRKRAEMWKERALAAEAALRPQNRWKLRPWEERKRAA